MNTQIRLFIALITLTMAGVTSAQSITKCQDAEGKWHYGNYAATECGDAPITRLSESGVTEEINKSPPTVEELQAEMEAREAERDALLKREENARIDALLKSKYPDEAAIIGIRDQQLAELRKQMTFNQTQLVLLNKELAALPPPKNEIDQQEIHDLEQRIARFERAVEQGQSAVNTTESDYKTLLERYRQIDSDG
ncbi:MAG: hypothetical protein DHS20C01_05220 [marine bacterium B5-7]|nr:MAG: hypothetical protein DHS20C01_05220 [marine bacterium B5-7]